MKKVLLLLAVLCSYCTLQAQTTTLTDSVTTPIQDQVYNLFSNYNTSQATSGFLLDRGFSLAPLELYTGDIRHDTCDLNLWKAAYLSLFTSQVQNKMTDPNTTIKTLGGTATGSTPIALGVLYYKAHRFKANAFDNGDVTITKAK